MENLNNTQYFTVQKEPELQVRDVLEIVFRALSEKGYNPVNQIVGYIMSGDPTYITSHNNARSLIMKVERDELVEEVLRAYIKNNYRNNPVRENYADFRIGFRFKDSGCCSE